MKKRPVNRDALVEKNRKYLASLRNNHRDNDLRSQIVAAIFDSTPDGILVFDENKRIVLANETAARLSGWDLEDLSRDELHKRFQFYVDDGATRMPVEEEPLEVAMRTKESCEREGLLKGERIHPNGLWFRAHAAPVIDGDGSVSGGVTIVQECSERVRLQRQRDCLVSLIAHDIKNHLAAESIFLRLIGGMLPEQVGKDVEEIINSLKRGNEKFLMMTESLMEMSRAKFFSTSGYGQVLDIREVLDAAIASNELQATQGRVSLHLTAESNNLRVNGIPAVIGQVFHNIILNAIEATDAGDTVEIKISNGQADSVRVQVIDRGPGISPEDLASLFDANRVAAHQPRRTSHSTGFGLYLSAMLIEGQGGTITCTSDKDKGTVVTVQFPSADAPHH